MRNSCIRLWELKTCRCIDVLSGHSSRVRTVAFNSEGKVLASASVDGSVCLWDVKKGACIAAWQVPRPYEGTDVTGVRGLTEAQRASMLSLGAVDHEPS